MTNTRDFQIYFQGQCHVGPRSSMKCQYSYLVQSDIVSKYEVNPFTNNVVVKVKR